ncbi:cytochrome P450 [Atractiella rhizophila]|nr:cytochrome P450 [Atractiella rhizophila]
MSYTTEVSLVLLAVIVYLVVKYPDRAIGVTRRRDLKGPPGWPIVGNLNFRAKAAFSIRQLEFGLAQSRLYGYARTFTIPGRRIIDVSRPEWLEHIQKTNFDNYVKGAIVGEVMEDVLGRGIFAVDGDTWYYQRKTTSHVFSTSRFRHVITDSVSHHIQILDKVLKSKVGQPAVNLSDIFYRFTLDTFAYMAFGKEIGSLHDESADSEGAEGRKFAAAFDACQTRLDERFNDFLFWKIRERWLSVGKRMQASVKIVNDYAYRIIDEKIEKAQSSQDAEREKGAKDLLDLFMAVRQENGSPLSRKELRDAVLNLMIAGRDTTAVALSWAFVRLLRNPTYVTWLREEIDANGDDTVDYDSFKSFHRVQAVWYETLRLHPPVPKNIKIALKDDQLPNGPKIEAGMLVRWGDWEMGRDTEIWGEDASSFRPERWLTSEGNLQRTDPWRFHAFNAGPRICVGQQFATFEGVTVLKEVIKNYDWDFAPGYWENVAKVDGKLDSDDIPKELCPVEDTPLYGQSLTLNMQDPLLVTFRTRKLG